SLRAGTGRLLGWFSGGAERPAPARMWRLLPLAMLIAAGLLGFAGLAMWQLNRLGFMLARSEQTVHKLAHADPITGVSNQHHLLETLDDGLAGRSGEEVVAFALLDFGGLDAVKDALGRAEEGRLLEEDVEHLPAAGPKGTAIGRLRGEKFGLVIRTNGAEEAGAIAGAARDAASRPYWLDQVVQISANVGLAIAPRDGMKRRELRDRADLALRTARR